MSILARLFHREGTSERRAPDSAQVREAIERIAKLTPPAFGNTTGWANQGTRMASVVHWLLTGKITADSQQTSRDYPCITNTFTSAANPASHISS